MTVAVAGAMAAAALVASIGLRAQQPPAQPAARPIVPMAASTIASFPESHYGENVAMNAAVARAHSAGCFSARDPMRHAAARTIATTAGLMP